MLRTLIAVLTSALVAATAQAHYHLLLLAKAATKEGQPIAVTWAFGHPFEQEFADVERPVKLQAFAPDGTVSDLLGELRPTAMPATGAQQKGPAAFTLTFTPPRRGDYVLWAEAAPHFAPVERTVYQDSVKVVLHTAQSQRGWDRTIGANLELVPLTRPYGLEPGLVFQTQALADGKPLAGAVVEVERASLTPPKTEDMPPDEQVTRKTKTDPNGVATCSLPDAGWWVITVTRDAGKTDKDGVSFRVQQRATLLVYVDGRHGKGK